MTPQELKNSILQLAIQGKLVEQRKEEGTAKELYQKICKKQDKLKKYKDELNFSSMDFEIPETWEWVEINEIFKFIDYRGKTPIKSEYGVFLITASNIKKGYMDYTRKEYISHEEYEKRQSRGITSKGDLIFTTEAPMGNIAICDLEECSCGQRIITFKSWEKDTIIYKNFMFFMLSPQFQKQLIDNCTGTTAKGIKAEKLKHLLIPLPPYEEQKRIVEKIEQLLPYIDKYKIAYEKLQTLNANFPEDMKKSLLQYAIQGKLVEQRKEEGTAKELLDKLEIKKEELVNKGLIPKKKKTEPYFKSEELSEYKIPDNWVWAQLADVSLIQEGAGIRKWQYRQNGIQILCVTNILDGDVDLDKKELYISEDEYEEKYIHLTLNKGDIVTSCSGGSWGKIAIYNKENKIILNTSTLRLRFWNDISFNKYLYYVCMSNFFKKQLQGQLSGMQPNFGYAHYSRIMIPLPPYEEQKRIVEKLEQLLPLCEKLK